MRSGSYGTPDIPASIRLSDQETHPSLRRRLERGAVVQRITGRNPTVHRFTIPRRPDPS